MKTVFICLALGGLWLFLFRRRQFDFVSVAFIGALIYFSPGFYGYVADPYYPDRIPYIPIYDDTYYVWIWALGALIITGLMYNPRVPINVPKLRTSDAFDWALIAMLIAAFLLWYWSAGDAIFSIDKFEILENQDRFYILFTSVTQAGLIAFILQGKWIKAIFPIAGGLLLLYIGFRYDVALAAIAIATHTAARRGIKSFMKPRYLVPIVALAVLMLSYKPLLFAYRAGRVDVAQSLIESADFVQASLLGSEPFIAQATLNEVVGRDYAIETSSLIYSLLAIVPFLLPLLGVSTDDVAFHFQEQLFPMIPYGLGSNIYSNFYATLGWMGVVIWIVAHCLILVLLSRGLTRVGQVLPLLILSWGAFFAFYVHRNDILNAMAFVNRPVVALLAVYFVSRLFSPARRTPQSQAEPHAFADPDRV